MFDEFDNLVEIDIELDVLVEEKIKKETEKGIKKKKVRNRFRELTEYKVDNEELFQYSCEAKKEGGKAICKNKAQKKLVGIRTNGFYLKKGLKEIENKKWDKSIKFLGFKKNIFSYLKNTDLYINTSYFEGFPNSVVEAAYCGVPIISSQSHGGINEILSNGKGGVIYQNGPDELATEIKKFFFNKSILRKKAIYAKKNSFKFNLLNHKKKFEKIITKI